MAQKWGKAGTFKVIQPKCTENSSYKVTDLCHFVSIPTIMGPNLTFLLGLVENFNNVLNSFLSLNPQKRSVDPSDPSQNEAALKIQTQFRQHSAKQEVEEKKEEVAATRIQAGFRGYLDREEVKKLK